MIDRIFIEVPESKKKRLEKLKIIKERWDVERINGKIKAIGLEQTRTLGKDYDKKARCKDRLFPAVRSAPGDLISRIKISLK